jgi:tripartite-type tricarboxylate transporter receptor subunit TctC
MRTTTFAALALAALTGLAQPSRAEWPKDKPIEFIVAFAPGGGSDVMIRTLAPFLEKHLGGARIVILNRPGAGGEIAYTAIAKAKPDGYTLSSLNTPGFLTMRLNRKLGFDPAEVLPVARIVEDPSMFVVRSDAPYKDLKELVAFAKANPGKVTIGTTGVGGDEHLATLQLEREAGIDLTPIPFAGSSEARTALLGGHISMIGLNIGEFLGADQSRIRALAQLSDTRSVAMPDLPTAKEQGYLVLMSSERGIGAPRGLPEEMRKKLAAAVEQSIKDPGFIDKAKSLSVPLAYVTGEQWEAQMPGRLDRFKAIWELTKAAP